MDLHPTADLFSLLQTFLQYRQLNPGGRLRASSELEHGTSTLIQQFNNLLELHCFHLLHLPAPYQYHRGDRGHQTHCASPQECFSIIKAFFPESALYPCHLVFMSFVITITVFWLLHNVHNIFKSSKYSVIHPVKIPLNQRSKPGFNL